MYEYLTARLLFIFSQNVSAYSIAIGFSTIRNLTSTALFRQRQDQPVDQIHITTCTVPLRLARSQVPYTYLTLHIIQTSNKSPAPRVLLPFLHFSLYSRRPTFTFFTLTSQLRPDSLSPWADNLLRPTFAPAFRSLPHSHLTLDTSPRGTAAPGQPPPRCRIRAHYSLRHHRRRADPFPIPNPITLKLSFPLPIQIRLLPFIHLK